MSKTSIINRPEKYIVSQSNNLIEAHYSTAMTARAHKVARLIFSLISPDDKDLRTYTVSIDALKHYLGMKSDTRWGAFRKELEDIQDRLNDKPIAIKSPDDGEYIRVPFVGLKVSPKKGTVTFEISTFLKPYLLALKDNYTSYLLVNIPKLKSAYSIRLYELLHQYRKIGKRYFELDDLQKKVGSTYTDKYNNFKRRVLIQAQKDLKKHTDLAFVFDETKEGRKVVGIQFIIFGNKPERKNPEQLSFLDDAFESNNSEKPALSEIIVQTLNNLGISEQNIAKYLAKGFDIIFDIPKRKAAKERCKTLENYYLEKLELTKNSATTGNPAGFLIKALQQDWTTSKTLQKHKNAEAIAKRKNAEKTLKQLEQKIEKLLEKQEITKKPVFERLLQNDDILKRAYKTVMGGFGDFIKGQLSSVKHLPLREQYAQKMMIKAGVDMYLQEHYADDFSQAKIIEDEIQTTKAQLENLKKEHPHL